MKLFLLGAALFSGSGAAAMQNETVNETVTEMYKSVRERVQKRVKEHAFDNIKENGFPYPTEERLESYTEDQQFAIISAIDQINATYDWANMTDDEIQEALAEVKLEMEALALELGIEFPSDYVQNRFHKRVRKQTREIIKNRLFTNLRETGIEYPNAERLSNLTEEQSTALIAKIDEFNATYDWATMTEEEILEAMDLVKAELLELHDEFGIIPVQNHCRGHNRNQEEPVEDPTDVPEGSDEA